MYRRMEVQSVVVSRGLCYNNNKQYDQQNPNIGFIESWNCEIGGCLRGSLAAGIKYGLLAKSWSIENWTWMMKRHGWWWCARGKRAAKQQEECRGGEASEIYNKKKHTRNKPGPRFSLELYTPTTLRRNERITKRNEATNPNTSIIIDHSVIQWSLELTEPPSSLIARQFCVLFRKLCVNWGVYVLLRYGHSRISLFWVSFGGFLHWI